MSIVTKGLIVTLAATWMLASFTLPAICVLGFVAPGTPPFNPWLFLSHLCAWVLASFGAMAFAAMVIDDEKGESTASDELSTNCQSEGD